MDRGGISQGLENRLSGRAAAADRLVPLLGALAIVAVHLLGLRDAAGCAGAAPANVPETTIRKGWFVFVILVEEYQLAQAITSPE